MGPDGLGVFGEVGEERKEGRALGYPSHIMWGIREASFYLKIYLREKERERA